MNKSLKTILVAVIAIVAVVAGFAAYTVYDNANTQSITLAHMTDLYIDKENKGGQVNALEYAIDDINKNSSVDLTLVSGNAVPFTDQEFIKYSFDLLSKLKNPWYYALGCHDTVFWGYIPKNEIIDMLKNKNKNFTFDNMTYSFSPKKGFTVIAVDTVDYAESSEKGFITDEDLNFVDTALAKNPDDTAIIFMNSPLIVTRSDKQDYNFKNAEQFNQVLKKHKQPIIILSGKYNTNNIKTEGNIVNVVTASLADDKVYRLLNIKNKPGKTVVKFVFKSFEVPGYNKWAAFQGRETDRNNTVKIKK